ncbi:MAG: copper chaperone PCu(A)C [Pseudomonadota bacterium]
MKPIRSSFAAALALTFSSLAAFAHDYAKAGLNVEHPWARPTFSARVPAAVYFDVVNNNTEDDRLIAVATDRAEHVELHLTEMSADSVASMKMLKDGIAVPAGEWTSMETGAYHVMLIGMDAPLKAGEAFSATLTFEKAGDMEVIVKIEDREKEGGAHAHH